MSLRKGFTFIDSRQEEFYHTASQERFAASQQEPQVPDRAVVSEIRIDLVVFWFYDLSS